MQDQNTTSTINTASVSSGLPGMKSVAAKQEAEKAAVAKVSAATPSADKPAASRLSMMPSNNLLKKIADKVKTSDNILVALSRDPSVDELAAAIGLTLFLDGLQKHTTAIYSGQTPDALRFLQPEGTFEDNTDSLQDFIISLNKEKADHLRYKLDGDFVRVYITPYKTLITEEDLEFSRGDFNVDLVLAIGVPSAADLDAALSEHGRIMHDAMTVDITCDAPGNFGEIEWSDPGASSVSEMVTKLIFELEGKDTRLDKDVATALLTGIVAATGRFSNDRTNSDTLQLASKLMEMGADQQLISAHVMDNDPGETAAGQVVVPEVKTDLAVDHNTPQVVRNDSVIVTPEVPSAPERAEMTPVAKVAMTEAGTGVPQASMAKPVQPVGAGAPAQANVAPSPVADIATKITQRPDYAQMMTDALSEPQAQNPTQISSAQVVAQPMVQNPVLQPVQGSQVIERQQTPTGRQSTDVGERKQEVADAQPVENPGVVLPPPPPPTASGQMMPPVLPPVQAPSDAAGQAQTDQGSGNAGAFKIPGA